MTVTIMYTRGGSDILKMLLCRRYLIGTLDIADIGFFDTSISYR